MTKMRPALKAFFKKQFPSLYMRLYAVKARIFRWRHPPDRLSHRHFKPYQVQLPLVQQTNPKRILHVIGNFHTGGSAQLVVDLIERLGHLYEQKVITKDLPEQPAYLGLDLQLCTTAESMQTVLENFQPHLVHVHYLGHEEDEWGLADKAYYEMFFGAAASFSFPVVENVNIPTYPMAHEKVKRYVYVSRYVLDQFGDARQPNEVIYPGSDFTRFRRSADEAPARDCIGMVYRLQRDKINEASIDVFIEVVKMRPQTKVVIIGGGVLLQPYKKAVRKAGVEKAFHFTGYLPYTELPQWYRKLSVFVAPVHSESFGQVTPFAMSMELPVAGYRVGALPEILNNEALLAPPGDKKTLARIIVDLLNDEERLAAIGRANAERARELFSVEAMVEGYAKIYQSAL